MKIFVSSTVKDLKYLRDEIYRKLIELGHTPLMSEKNDFPINLHPDSKTNCLKVTEECDLLVLILDKRAGIIYNATEKSPYPELFGYTITEAEYRNARQKNIPVCIFINEKTMNESSIYRSLKNNQNIDDQIEEKFYSDPEVYTFIDRLMHEDPHIPWIYTFNSNEDVLKPLCSYIENCENENLNVHKHNSDEKPIEERYQNDIIILNDELKNTNFELNSELNDEEIINLIQKAHNKQILLSECISDALKLALEYGDEELFYFCKKELTGWEGERISRDDKHNYRIVEFICSPIEISRDWYGTAEEMFTYMENHHQEFGKSEIFQKAPISIYEQDEEKNLEKHYIHRSMPSGKLMPDYDGPIRTVHCYARSNIYKILVERIRANLTEKLLNLFEKN